MFRQKTDDGTVLFTFRIVIFFVLMARRILSRSRTKLVDQLASPNNAWIELTGKEITRTKKKKNVCGGCRLVLHLVRTKSVLVCGHFSRRAGYAIQSRLKGCYGAPPHGEKVVLRISNVKLFLIFRPERCDIQLFFWFVLVKKINHVTSW